MAKTNFSGPITTGRYQFNGASQVRTAQFLQNSAQFPIDFNYFEATTDDNRIATEANNPVGTTNYTLEDAAATNVSGLTYGGGIPGMKFTIASGSDERALTFSVVGTDCNGFRQTEDITGPNATTVSSAQMYKTITDVTSDVVSVGAIKMGILATDKISWPLRSLFNIEPGSAGGGAAETSTSASKNLANNIVIPKQSRLIELKMFNYTAYDTAGLDVEFGSNISDTGGSMTNSFDPDYFTTTVDAKATGLFSAAGSSGGTALPQAVGLAPRMFNVSNGDTAGYEVEKILCMTASSDDTMSTGYGVITATWLQLNNGTN
jgi:hypothetical protein